MNRTETANHMDCHSTEGHIEKIHKYIRPEDVPEKTMFFIITDGLENASTRYQLELFWN